MGGNESDVKRSEGNGPGWTRINKWSDSSPRPLCNDKVDVEVSAVSLNDVRGDHIPSKPSHTKGIKPLPITLINEGGKVRFVLAVLGAILGNQ